MSALVPYAASELSTPAAQLGYAVGTQLGSAALNAGKRMFDRQRERRGRTKRRKTTPTPKSLDDLGRPAGHTESKRNDRQSAPTAISNKELEDEPLIRVEKDVAANENITKRQRDIILHKGTKVCFSCKNIRTEPIYLNWAIVTPKAVNSINSGDFLRGDDIERETPVDVNATFMDLYCQPINRDRYNVVRHKKHLILPDSDKTGSVKNGKDFIMIEDYIKTNRQIFFDGDTATPLQNMFMVWWVDYYGSPTGSNALTAEVQWKMVNYFKEL